MLCFATVGTTQFDGLVEALLSDEVLQTLHSMRVDELCVQCGSGRIPEGFEKRCDNDGSDGDESGEESWYADRHGILIQLVHYMKSVVAMMARADLVIGHAGAGTCLEVLELGKPFVVVVNTTLADNHQLELAERLAAGGHLLFTPPERLADTLRRPQLFHLTPFERADPRVFADFLDGVLGVHG